RKPPRKFSFSIRLVNEIDTQTLERFLLGQSRNEPSEIIRTFELALRHLSSLNNVSIGRNFFNKRFEFRRATGGIEIWNGFHQSIRAGEGRLLVNLDTAATAFHAALPLVDYAAQFFKKQHPADIKTFDKVMIHKLSRALRGVKVTLNHRQPQRPKKTISKFSDTSADRTMFIKDDGTSQSVADYFAVTYNRRLNFPWFPCVVVNQGGVDLFFPMEVCTIIEGQRVMRKLDGDQTTAMIDFTKKRPSDRRNKITNFRNDLSRPNPYLDAFGIQISRDMATLDARLLPPPNVHYSPESKDPVVRSSQNENGSWNLIKRKVAVGRKLLSWGVVVFGSENQVIDQNGVKGFIKTFVEVGEASGMFVGMRDPPIMYSKGVDVENDLKVAVGNVARKTLESGFGLDQGNIVRPQLLVCVLPDKGVQLYGEIKRVTDTVIGMPSQCVQTKQIQKDNKQYCANVWLKVNVKLGGINTYLGTEQLPFLKDCPTIIIGIDVTHPGAGENSPSIAAAVGTMDAQCARYSASIRSQPARIEVVQDLKGMIIELINTFRETNNSLPSRILIYRDGVSDGQIAKVKTEELESVFLACREIRRGYRPDVTVLIVQKRHHVRFFPLSRDDESRSGNVRPGTVVDSDVTHPSNFGLQGTSRPTHYLVIHDENRFTADSLQKLTYHLCYLYCRATCSVSVCPPAYYADLVAARARYHFRSTDDDRSSLSSGSGVGAGWGSQIGVVKDWLRNVMYFM
ncbi:hypothetical protein HDU76_003748, partial [Blyttiomyces sp. JEL0837]